MVWACWPRSARVSLSVAFAVLRRWRLPCMMLAISPNGGKMIQRAILIGRVASQLMPAACACAMRARRLLAPMACRLVHV